MRVFQCARGNAVMQFTSLDQARHYIGKGGRRLSTNTNGDITHG
jgi:hypothetical protein